MFIDAMDFFQQRASLKKPVPKHFFPSLLKNLLMEDLVTLGNLLSINLWNPVDNSMHLQAGELGCHKI
jgi:hypothetical protein